jgi:hypothetical protein
MEAGGLTGPFSFVMFQLPHLIRHHGQQFRLGIFPMPQLIAAFPHCGTALQQAIHRSDRGQVAPFVQQLGVNGCRCAIDQARAVEHIEHKAAVHPATAPMGTVPDAATTGGLSKQTRSRRARDTVCCAASARHGRLRPRRLCRPG